MRVHTASARCMLTQAVILAKLKFVNCPPRHAELVDSQFAMGYMGPIIEMGQWWISTLVGGVGGGAETGMCLVS